MSNVCAKNVHGCADLYTSASSCWYYMRDKSGKEIPSSKKSANRPDKISVYYSDVKGPSKYIRAIKVLFHIPHYTFTDQRTWWRRFGRIRCGFSKDQQCVIHIFENPTTKLYSKNLDFHPQCLTRSCKNQNDAPGLPALVPAPGRM